MKTQRIFIRLDEKEKEKIKKNAEKFKKNFTKSSRKILELF